MRTANLHEAMSDPEARRSERYRVRLYVGRAGAAKAAGNYTVIYDLSRTGFLTDAVPGRGPGDWLRLHLPTIGDVEARIVREADGLFGCEFSQPLTQAQLVASRAGSKVIWPEFGAPQPRAGAATPQEPVVDRALFTDLVGPEMIDEPERWPVPVRTAIWLGGAAALWGLVALAIR